MSVPGGPYPFVNPHNIARYVCVEKKEKFKYSLTNFVWTNFKLKAAILCDLTDRTSE